MIIPVVALGITIALRNQGGTMAKIVKVQIIIGEDDNKVIFTNYLPIRDLKNGKKAVFLPNIVSDGKKLSLWVPKFFSLDFLEGE